MRARMLSDGLADVKARGGARPGDTTMVDALEPAAAAAEAGSGGPLAQALSAADAARVGAERTRDMLAALGKAKTLGERARGHVDPGAESTRLILALMHEAVSAGAGGGRT